MHCTTAASLEMSDEPKLFPLFPNMYEIRKWHTIKDFSYNDVPLTIYGVLHSLLSGSDKSRFDSLLKYLMKFKYDVSLNSLTIALFIA